MNEITLNHTTFFVRKIWQIIQARAAREMGEGQNARNPTPVRAFTKVAESIEVTKHVIVRNAAC